MEEHRNAFGQPFAAGHSAGLRDQQIGDFHQLVDLTGEADQRNVGMTVCGIFLHLAKQLLVLAETKDNLHPITPAG
ncbi:hypothetical protein D3C75_1278080 [compost metagenome]